MSQPENKLKNEGHDFDGIQEYDNDLPRWWVALFYVTIVFSAGYLAWYHLPFFPSESLVASYEKEKMLEAERRGERLASQSEGGEFDLVAAVKDTDKVARGKAAYSANCASCHAADGGGLVGPNLVDDFWVHGSSYAEVLKIILEGAPAKGMPGWASVLGEERSSDLVVYLKSIQGAKTASPKAPQGEPGVMH